MATDVIIVLPRGALAFFGQLVTTTTTKNKLIREIV